MQYKYETIRKDGLSGIADEHDNIIIPCIYNMILSYNEECIEVKDKNDLWGLINIKNEVIIPCKYKSIFIDTFNKETLIMVQDKNDLWGIFNTKNEILIPCKYKDIIIYNKIIRCYLGNYRITHYFIKNNKILIYNKKKLNYAV